MTDISVILTAHKEGILCGVTARSALTAIDHAKEAGATVDVVVVLDNADDITTQVLENTLGDIATIEHTAYKDPGQSRNHGIRLAKGTFSTFLDGDDLWSENWLVDAWTLAKDRPDAVLHSHCNIVFGDERNIWWHVDSEGEIYDPDYLTWANYWDAMSFAATDIYRKLPFKANALSEGFGHEDWHWNVQTVRHGIPHKPVPGTIHFKRRRQNSQMAQVHKSDAVIWPDA